MTTTALRLNYKALRHKVNHRVHSLGFPAVHWKPVYVMATLLSLLMLVFYIISMNNLIKGSYTIKNYNKEVQSLLTENRDLQTNFASVSFLALAQERATKFDFEKITGVKYIQILQSSLAQGSGTE